MVAGAGDIAVATAYHEKADDAASLGALAGSQSASQASLYSGSPQMDTTLAPQNCLAAAMGVIGTALPSSDVSVNCVMSVTTVGPAGQAVTCLCLMTTTVTLTYQPPIGAPWLTPEVKATRKAMLGVGTETPQ
jgi:hypothetical protein